MILQQLKLSRVHWGHKTYIDNSQFVELCRNSTDERIVIERDVGDLGHQRHLRWERTGQQIVVQAQILQRFHLPYHIHGYAPSQQV
jgi:hypothetical protein